MPYFKSLTTLFLLIFIVTVNAAQAAEGERVSSSAIVWHPWSEAIFEQAKRENKLVIMDLEAVWCHWCHVMEERTYQNAAIIKLMQKKYIAVRVDQDANPDISVRYEDYGWPATIIFSADGNELVKRRGYIPPENMAKILQAVIDDPTAGPSVTKQSEPVIGTETQFSTAQRNKLIADINSGYDEVLGGWGNVHKFILAPNVEYAMVHGRQGDKALEKKARETLDKALLLIDPEWGGVYQYSDRGRWDSPHFEKIMSIQTDDLRLYALASQQFNEPRYLKAAHDIDRYLANFLTSADGAFYTSQDADASTKIDGHTFYPLNDKARRALGVMPRIDKNIYARENGWAIRSLAALYDVTGDKAVLNRAIRSANWIEANRAIDGGGFRHAEQDPAGPYLGDTLAMAEAYLALYVSTADRAWLTKSQQAVNFMQHNFKTRIGYATAVVSKTSKGIFQKPLLQMEENVSVVRLSNQLAHYSGDAQYQLIAQHAMKYLVALASDRYMAGPLTAAEELATEPAHITVVGAKSDPAAQALYQQALQYPVIYRRIEWWDKTEGAMPNSDVQYPQLAKAAAFICVNHACSTPIFEPAKLSAKADLLLFSAE